MARTRRDDNIEPLSELRFSARFIHGVARSPEALRNRLQAIKGAFDRVGYTEVRVRKLLETGPLVRLGQDGNTNISLWASADRFLRLRLTAAGADPQLVTWSAR